MPDRPLPETLSIQLLGQTEFGCSARPIRILRCQPRFQLILVESKNTPIALCHPISKSIQILTGVDPMESLEASVNVSDFVGPHDAPTPVDPDGGTFTML